MISEAAVLRAITNMQKLCDRYVANYAGRKKSGGEDVRMIEAYVRPALGHKAAGKVRYADIDKLHQDMRDTPYQANRVLSVLSKMFTLAQRWEVEGVDRNPCQAVERFPEKKRRAYATDDQLRAIIAALEARFERWPLEAGLLLLLLYTGARCGEMKGVRWVELHGTEMYLPDSKTGQCTVYMTPQALGVLARLPRARDWIIGQDIEPRWVWASVAKEVGVDLRIHDLRHCFASIGISANLALPKIGGLLRHANPATTQGYAHLVPSEGRAAAIIIGQQFERISA